MLIDNGFIKNYDEIEGIGHRVVFAGNNYKEPVIIDDHVIKVIDSYSNQALAHNPAAALVINVMQEYFPNASHTASFDSSFHQTMPDKNKIYPIPIKISEKNEFQKHGYHSPSNKAVLIEAKKLSNIKKGNFITGHIGNGVSFTTIKDWKSIWTSMGYSPNSGAMMGNRSGEIDPEIVIALMEKYGTNETRKILTEKSGIFGLSGMRGLNTIYKEADQGNKKAILTKEIYLNSLAENFAKSAINMQDVVEAIVFTGGIGEHNARFREDFCNRISSPYMPLYLDKNLNEQTVEGKTGIISSVKSVIPMYVFSAKEELMILRDCYKTINKNYAM